ncbi:MAG: hypothetical protein U9Q77_06515, partial [Candidatus Marinimicrobia bacterium]|nr:hypothetical protein [Candidatus Neomarinimicrobiota bacterium]
FKVQLSQRLLLLMLISTVLGDQPERKTIEASSNYYWGNATASARTEARASAEQELLSKIQVTLNYKFESIVTETNAELDERVMISSQSYTNLLLKGLNYMDSKRFFKWNAFVYIHKDSVAAAFKIRRKKLEDYSELAGSALAEANIGEALRLYYWGYLLGKTYPDQISMRALDGSRKNIDAALGFQTAVKTILHRIAVRPGVCYQDGDVIMVPLFFTYADKPINNLLFSYYSGMGMDYGLVEAGQLELPLYDNPTMAKRKLTLNYEYLYENEMDDASETLILSTLFNTGGFPNVSTVSITFPWLKEDGQQLSSVVEPQTEVVDMLSQVREDINESLRVLSQYKRMGTISILPSGSNTTKTRCWVVLADKQKVHHLLYYSNNTYTDYNSGETFNTLADFKGYKSIWFQENQ